MHAIWPTFSHGMARTCLGQAPAAVRDDDVAGLDWIAAGADDAAAEGSQAVLCVAPQLHLGPVASRQTGSLHHPTVSLTKRLRSVAPQLHLGPVATCQTGCLRHDPALSTAAPALAALPAAAGAASLHGTSTIRCCPLHHVLSMM